MKAIYFVAYGLPGGGAGNCWMPAPDPIDSMDQVRDIERAIGRDIGTRVVVVSNWIRLREAADPAAVAPGAGDDGAPS